MKRPKNLRKLPWKLRYETGAMAASSLRKLAIRVTHQHCTVRFDGPVRLGPGFALHIPERGSFIVGPGVDFRRGFYCEISGNGVVEIGAGTTFTSNTMIQCGTSVKIGRRCGFGQSTFIVDGNHTWDNPDQHYLDAPDKNIPIEIGDNVAVLTKCTIINSIGERSVIGADSVVTNPIPPYCLALGAPARVIRYFGDPDKRPADLPDGV